MLSLSNNTAVNNVFNKIDQRFSKLYSKKVYVHHYTEYIDQSEFDIAQENLRDIISTYEEISQSEYSPFEFDDYKRIF